MPGEDVQTVIEAPDEKKEDGVWLTFTDEDSGYPGPEYVMVLRYEYLEGGGLRKVLTEDGERYVRVMASKGCTFRDIAAEMGVSDRTLYADHNKERAQTAYRIGTERCDSKIRRAQVSHALDGNTQLLIWLGKVRLGQRDETAVEVVVRDRTTVTFDELDAMFPDDDDGEADTLQGS